MKSSPIMYLIASLIWSLTLLGCGVAPAPAEAVEDEAAEEHSMDHSAETGAAMEQSMDHSGESDEAMAEQEASTGDETAIEHSMEAMAEEEMATDEAEVTDAASAAMKMEVPADLDIATTQLSEQALYQATISSQVEPISINEIHNWVLHIETAEGQPVDNATITVDGTMPQHAHGMPTAPQVTQELGNGDYLVEGMRFQMAGWWEVTFNIEADGQNDKVSFNLILKN